MPDPNSIVQLQSGRKFYANCGIVGIDADGQVSEGYDGGIPEAHGDALEDADNWSPEECCELADIMIERWQRYQERSGFLSE